jgi:hypothetical protein
MSYVKSSGSLLVILTYSTQYSSKGVVKEIKHENKLGLLREKASYADVVGVVILNQSVLAVMVSLGVFKR